MKTVPSIITTEARRGELFYAVEILPNAGETWDAHRWATQECRIDGDDYEGGAITKVGRISYRAKVKLGGSAATRDRIEITARNKKTDGSARFQELAEQPIGGRIISIKAGCVPPNLCKNSSFEDIDGGVFEHWAHYPGAGGSISQAGSGLFGSYVCQIFSVSAAEKSQIITEDITLKRGQPITVSFYLKAQTAGDQSEVFFRINNSHNWIVSSGTWVLGSTATATYTPATGSWTRYSFEIPVEKLAEHFPTTSDEATITLGINAAGTTDLIFADGVMISPRDYLIDYSPAMHDLTSSDVLNLYTGEVFDYDLTNQKIRIITRSMASLRHRKIPITTLDEELVSDLGAVWVIPPRNLGKPVPITYGNFWVTPKTAEDQRQPGKVPALGILCNYINGPSAGDEVRVLFDRPGGVIHHYNYYDVLAWSGDGQQWLHQMLDDKVSPTYVASEFVESASNCAFKGAAGVGYINNGRLPLSIYQRGREHVLTADVTTSYPWANELNAIDYDNATYAARVVSTNDNGSSTIYYVFEPIAIKDGTLIGAYCCFSGVCVVSTITGGTVHIYVAVDDVRAPTYQEFLILTTRTTPGSDTIQTMPGGGGRETDWPFAIASPADTLAFWASSGRSVKTQVRSTHVGGLGAWTGYARCTDVEFRVDLSVDLLEADIFGSIRSREFLSTWESRKTSGNEILICADTIEGLLRDELGIAGADIDTDSFDAAYTARSGGTGIALAGQVVKFEDSEDVIGEMCECSGLMYYNDLDGKEKLVTLDKKSTPDFTLGYGDLIEDSLKIRFSRRDEVITNFTLNYGFNPVTEEYHMRHYCNKDGSSFASGGSTYEGLCDNAFDAVGLEVVKDFNCKWINEDTSAQNLLKFLINWLTYPKCFVEFETYFDMIGIELGDQGLLNFPDHMPSTTEDSYFVVESISAKYSTRRIRLELIEIRAAV